MSTTAILNMQLPIPAAVGSLDAYIGAVHRIPILDVSEEQDLARRFRENNDLDAAQVMVMSHLRFVVHVARGYAGYGLPLSDLIQEGNIGLMKAVKRFDPAIGVRLVSFAVHWIRAEMHEFILKNWRIVKVATTKAQRKLFFNLRKSKKRLGWMNSSEVDAIARDLNVDSGVVMEMEARMAGHDLAFDAPSDQSSETHYSPVDYLQAEHSDPAVAFESGNWEEQQHGALEDGLSALDERSQDIIRRRWMVEPKATLQELADLYKVSAERIRQIEAVALKKLKAVLTA